MADNTILDAKVKISIDNSTIDKQISNTSKKVEAALAKANAKASTTLTKQIDKGIGKVGRDIEKGADKLSKVLEKGLKFGLATGTTAIYAFLKSGTPEAQKFASSLDRVKIAWAKVGQTLATKINFRGKNLTEWVDVLADKLSNLDISQIKKIVDYFKIAAATWAGIKLFQGVAALAGFANNLQGIYKGFKGLSALGDGSQAGTSLGGAGNAAIAGSAFGISRVRIKNYSPEKDLDGYFKAKDAGKLAEWGEVREARAEKLRIARRNQNLVRGASAIAGTAYGASSMLNTYNDNSLSNSEKEFKLTGTAAGTAIGALASIWGPIGTALGYAIGEGANTLWKNIFDAFYDVNNPAGAAISKASGKSASQNGLGETEVAYRANLRRLARGEKAIKDEDMFSSNQYKMGMSEPMRQLERQYIGKPVPLSERMKLMPSVPTNVGLMEERIKKLKSTVPEGEDITQYSTIFAEVQALETLIDTQKKFAADTMALSEQIAETKKDIAEKYKENMQKISDNIQESKDNLKQNLEDFDFNAASRQTARAEAADYKAFQEGNKPLSTSISMGGDIGSIGSIISQGLNDANNAKAQADADNRQKQIDVAIEAKDELIATRAEAKERDRMIEENRKKIDELEKEKLQVDKDQLKELKTLNRTVGGPSTVTNA